MLSPGDTLGRYRILARLRAGGMATLYLGQRTGAAGFTRPVAIKVIHPHLAENPRFVEMFVDEARLSAKLDDPHIVHVEELGEARGTYFLVMEYVDGVSLAQLLRELGRRKRALSPDVATWIALQIAAGLHAAHEATDEQGRPMRLVHRDVSPHNVLLAYKGHVKLIDFGVAKAHGHTKDTESGSLRGKLAYMPPEQAYGRPVDRRVDVYALGIVLWEMLTMRRLFTAESDLALLEQVRRPQVFPPSRLVAGIPPALDGAVMRALAPEPDARPETADALAMQLAAAVPGAVGKSARDVATMIAAVMPDVLEQSRRRLSELLGANAKIESAPDIGGAEQEALATMTIESPEATVLFAEDERASASPGGVAMRASGTTPARGRRAIALGLGAGAAAAVAIGLSAAAWSMRARVPAAAVVSGEPQAEPAPAPIAASAAPPLDAPVEPSSAPPEAASAPSPSRAKPSRGVTHPKRATTGTPPAASVEMHGGVPIFNRGL